MHQRSTKQFVFMLKDVTRQMRTVNLYFVFFIFVHIHKSCDYGKDSRLRKDS